MGDAITGYEHDGWRFDVTDTGPRDGPVVVALHGFPQTAVAWAGVTPHLAAAGRRVLAPDQRGYSPGARPPEVSAYRVDRLAGDVLALADVAGVEHFDLVGHDWGGAVAWYLAAAHPDRVRTLTVVSTPHPSAMLAAMPYGQALRSWYMGLFQVPGLPEWLLRVRGGAVARRLMRSMAPPDGEAMIAFLADPDVARATINWYRAAFRPGVPAVGKVGVPTTYVWSDRDPALGRRAAEATARHVSGDYRFVVLPGVTHWIPEEEPDVLARLILERIEAASGRIP